MNDDEIEIPRVPSILALRRHRDGRVTFEHSMNPRTLCGAARQVPERYELLAARPATPADWRKWHLTVRMPGAVVVDGVLSIEGADPDDPAVLRIVKELSEQAEWWPVVDGALVPEDLHRPWFIEEPTTFLVNPVGGLPLIASGQIPRDGDLFAPGTSNIDIAVVYAVMAACHWHKFEVRSTRPDRVNEWLARVGTDEHDVAAMVHTAWGGYCGTMKKPPKQMRKILRDDNCTFGEALLAGCSEWPLENVKVLVDVGVHARLDNDFYANAERSKRERAALVTEGDAAYARGMDAMVQRVGTLGMFADPTDVKLMQRVADTLSGSLDEQTDSVDGAVARGLIAELRQRIALLAKDSAALEGWLADLDASSLAHRERQGHRRRRLLFPSKFGRRFRKLGPAELRELMEIPAGELAEAREYLPDDPPVEVFALVLEDDKHRTWFENGMLAGGGRVVVMKNPREFVTAALTLDNVTHLFLDHDLGHFEAAGVNVEPLHSRMTGSGGFVMFGELVVPATAVDDEDAPRSFEITGSDVARALAERWPADKRKPIIVIHSEAQHSGPEDMRSYLRDAGWVDVHCRRYSTLVNRFVMGAS